MITGNVVSFFQCYNADMGLLVPSVSLQLRQQILEAAVQCGYSAERQLEMIGRAASEMVLQLLGGCRRCVIIGLACLAWLILKNMQHGRRL